MELDWEDSRAGTPSSLSEINLVKMLGMEMEVRVLFVLIKGRSERASERAVRDVDKLYPIHHILFQLV